MTTLEIQTDLRRRAMGRRGVADALLIDSTVLIDEQRGDARARAFLEPLLTRGAALIHPVSAAEVLAGSTIAEVRRP